MQNRDFTKQSATATSDAIYVLSGGAAAPGHRTFETAYQVPSQGTAGGVLNWPNVAIKVEHGTDWQIVVGTLRRADATPLDLQLVDGVVTASSTGAALGLTGAAAVTVTQVASEASFGLMAIKARPAYATWADGMSRNGAIANGLGHPQLFNGGLFSVGPDSSGAGAGTVAVGHGANTTMDYAATLGGFYAYANMYGEHCGGTSSKFGTANTAISQHGRSSLNGHTTDATPGKLGFTAGTTALGDGVYLDSGLTILDGYITAVDTATGDKKVWKFHIVWDTSFDYVTSAVLASDFTEVYEAAGATSWSVAASADSGANQGNIDITGEAATDIMWSAEFSIHYHWVYV